MLMLFMTMTTMAKKCDDDDDDEEEEEEWEEEEEGGEDDAWWAGQAIHHLTAIKAQSPWRNLKRLSTPGKSPRRGGR